jgi:UDP:flavonoid glycosyltransferase YjiC (YdhE family)
VDVVRILMTAEPSFGHVNPVLPLARAAQRAGHDVVVATGDELTDHVRRHGLPVWLVGRSRAEVDARFHAANPDLDRLGFEERIARMAEGLFVQAADDRVPDLLARTADWRPHVVISETGELAGPIVAARRGARHLVHGVSTPPPRSLWDDAFGTGYARLCRNWDVPDRLLDAVYLDIWPKSLVAEPCAWSRTQPLQPVGGPVAPGQRLPWDDLPHAKTVHLTLGTIFADAPGVLEAAVAGLRELPVNLVVTVGPQGDPARFGPQPPHVRVERYVPHELLLPVCDLLVDHAGAGILLAGFRHGLPQLLLPQGIDQFGNAAAAREAGAALSLSEVTAEGVAEAARRLLAEPGFAEAARAVQAEIADMPSADETVALLGR